MVSLNIVGEELDSPPYDKKTRSKGMDFDIDVERLVQSKTWLLASDDMKPWLLRIWVESWRSIPVGSFEDDDEIISARIGMPLNTFQANKKVILRGWKQHSDGLLYHSTITELVLKMVGWRENEKNRKQAWRDKQRQKNNNLQYMSHGTPTSVPRERRGATSCDDTSSSSSSSSSSSVTKKKQTKKKPIKTTLPEGFEISERVRTWAVEKKHTRLEEHLEYFVGYARANSKEYASWDDAFMNSIRGNWAKLNDTRNGNSTMQNQQQPQQRPLIKSNLNEILR